MGDVSMIADLALERSRYRHASGLLSMSDLKVLFVAAKARRVEIGR